jgi:hypothetical protein
LRPSLALRYAACRGRTASLDAIAKLHRLGATARCHLSRKAEVGRWFINAAKSDPATA